MIILKPKFAILPGTEDMAGYNDFGFHVRGFGIGTALSLAAGGITAGVVSLLQAIG
jgi:hypothetical protein